MRMRMAVLAVGVLALGIPAAGQTVRTRDGLVSGVKMEGVTSFKGIPFAAPPVGELRWRPPMMVDPWTGVKKADHFSASCMQTIRKDGLPWTTEFLAQEAPSEDCLYLNVWAPAGGGMKRPVLVWVHGGAFVEGSGAAAVYDGEALAKKGIVVVTINYRLAAFGFMAHPALTAESPQHASGDYGLMDVVAALKWVKENIGAFGGDAAQVTVAGQSAGAQIVVDLTASPMAKGLFRGAIIESGAFLAPPMSDTLQDAEEKGVAFAGAAGAQTLKDLRAMDAGALVALYARAGVHFRPDVDGWMLMETVSSAFAAGRQNDVPTIDGMVADEGSSSKTYGKTTVAEYAAMAQKTYGAQVADYLRLYPGKTDAEAGESMKASARDMGLVSMNLWAEKRGQTARTAAYTYYFDRAIPWPEHPEYQAFHSGEIPYVLGNLAVLKRPYTSTDSTLEKVASGYWVNFVRTGDPNGGSLPMWQAVKAGEHRTMELGAVIGPRPVTSGEKMRFWRAYLLAQSTAGP